MSGAEWAYVLGMLIPDDTRDRWIRAVEKRILKTLKQRRKQRRKKQRGRSK